MMFLLTEIGLTPNGSITVHIYTETIHRTAQITTEQHKLWWFRLCQHGTGLGTEKQPVTSVKQMTASVTILFNAEQQVVWLILNKCEQESSDPMESITSYEPSVFWNNSMEILRSCKISSMIYMSLFSMGRLVHGSKFESSTYHIWGPRWHSG